jgi:hypothetical protein
VGKETLIYKGISPLEKGRGFGHMAFSWPQRPHVPTGRGVGALNLPSRWSSAAWVALRRHLLLGQPADTAGALAPTEAFDRLFERHERQIFGYLWRMTSDHALASDLCQETFFRAWPLILPLTHNGGGDACNC